MKLIDLTEKVFGRLTVLRRGPTQGGGQTTWVCRCACGSSRDVIVQRSGLVAGKTVSCGCHRKELTTQVNTIHGHRTSKDPSGTYRTWMAMHRRCSRPGSVSYQYYGGKGIKVCERWSNFERFLADMGERPAGKTLDRVDGDGHYEPGNCRWATPKEQAQNRRKAVLRGG